MNNKTEKKKSDVRTEKDLLSLPARLLFVFLVVAVMVFVSPALASGATITTDKTKYSLGEPMIITGAGFTPGDPVNITVLRPDKVVDTLPTVTADASGGFVTTYYPPQIPGRYTITATDGVNSAETASTEADASYPFAQCADGSPTVGTCNWIGSDINAQNSIYYEGMSVPQRLILEGIPAQTGGNMRFGVMFTKAGKFSYDFLTNWSQAITVAHQDGLTGYAIGSCDNLGKSDTTTCNNLLGAHHYVVNVPGDPYVTTATTVPPGAKVQDRIDAYEIKYGARTIDVYADGDLGTVTLKDLGHDTAKGNFIYSGDSSKDSFNEFELDWTGSAPDVMIQFAGHLAMGGTSALMVSGTPPSGDPVGSYQLNWYPGSGNAGISGSSYHFYIDGLDYVGNTPNVSVGSIDNQITGAAVFTPPAPATQLTLKSAPTSAEIGNPIIVVVTENNTGNVALSAVSVTGSPCATWTAPAGFTGSLAVGATADFTCTFTAALPSPDTWSAQGQGTDPNGNPVPSANENQSGSVPVTISPATNLTLKSVSPSPAEIGSTVTVVVTEKNTGDVNLTGVSVTGGGSCASFTGGASTLAVGASTDFTCTFTAALPSPDTWSAQGQGTDPNGNPVPSANENQSGTVTVLQPHTTISIVPNVFETSPGENVILTISDTNDGGVPLTNASVVLTYGSPTVTVTFNLTNLTSGDTNHNGILDVSETWTWTYSVLISSTTTFNVAGNGTDPLGNYISPPSYPTEAANVTVKTIGTTRTLGFWQTHTNFTSYVFNLSSMQQYVGFIGTASTSTHKGNITNILAQGQSQLFGGFYAPISKTTTGVKRSQVDQARIQILQQLLAAKLNCAAFGCSTNTTNLIAQADADYLAGNTKAMLADANALNAFNNQGDTNAIPSTLPPTGSATPQTSQLYANLAFWDSP